MSGKPVRPGSAHPLRKAPERPSLVLAALAVSLAFFVGCLLAQEARVPEKTAASAGSASFEQLIPEGRGTPVSVAITQGGEGFTLLEENGQYRLDGEDAALDANAARDLLAIGSSVLARHRLEGAQSEYGIDNRSLTACFNYQDQTTLTLHLGDPTPTGEGWYAAVEGDPDVYVVNNALGRTLAAGKQALYALPDLSAYFTAQTLNVAAIQRPGEETITIARVTQANPFNTMVELTTPIHYPANSERAAQVYLALENIRPTGLAALDGRDADWGLDEPLAVITLEDHVRTRLTLGQAGDVRTLRVNEDRAVYTIDADALSFLRSLTVPYLAEQLPGLVMLSQLSAVSVRTPDRTLRFDVDQPSGSYQLEGRALSEERFVPVYQQMIGLLIERYVPSPEKAGEARLQLEYTFREGGQWTLTIAEYDESFDLIIRDGCACFLLSRAKTDALIETILTLEEEEP